MMKMVILEGSCPECKTVISKKEPLRNIDSEFSVVCKSCGNGFNLPVKKTEK